MSNFWISVTLSCSLEQVHRSSLTRLKLKRCLKIKIAVKNAHKCLTLQQEPIFDAETQVGIIYAHNRKPFLSKSCLKTLNEC